MGTKVFFNINGHRFASTHVEQEVSEFFANKGEFSLKAPRWLMPERTDFAHIVQDTLFPAAQFATGAWSFTKRLAFDLLTLTFRIAMLVPRVLYNACADRQQQAFVRFARCHGIEERVFHTLLMAEAQEGDVKVYNRVTKTEQMGALDGDKNVYWHLWDTKEKPNEADFGQKAFRGEIAGVSDAERMEAIEKAFA